MSMGSDDDGSDTEVEINKMYSRMSRTGRAAVMERLNRQHENNFITKMIRFTKSDLVHAESREAPKKKQFDAAALLQKSITSWQNHRKFLSSSKFIATKRNSDMNSSRIEGRTKVRRDRRSLQLNEFLNSLQSQIIGAASEVQGVPKLKLEPLKESVLDRPSQMIKLQASDAGTDSDELKDARAKILQKLSKNCADWIVNNCSPSAEERNPEGLARLVTIHDEVEPNRNTSFNDGLTLVDSIYQLGPD